MLSILIGLACIAVIVAFAEHLIAGLLWIGVAALALAGIALAFVVLSASAPLLNQLVPLLLLGGVAWFVALALKRHGAWLTATALRKARGIVSPKSWSANGVSALGWVLLIGCVLAPGLFYSISRGHEPPSVVLILSSIGMVASVVLIVWGGWWKLVDLFRRCGEPAHIGLAGAVAIGSVMVLIGGVVARVEAATNGTPPGQLGGILLAIGGFLMFVGAAASYGLRQEELRTQGADGNSAS